MNRKQKILDLHKENPNIYLAFEKMALKKFRQRKYYSSRTLIELLRWETEEGTNDQFKINNDFSVLCSRLFVKRHPKYSERFQFRTSIFDEKEIANAQLEIF